MDRLGWCARGSRLVDRIAHHLLLDIEIFEGLNGKSDGQRFD